MGEETFLNIANNQPVKTRPGNKRKTSIPGRVINLSSWPGKNPGKFEQNVEQIIPYLLKKQWYIIRRPGFIALTGAKGIVRDYIPPGKRKSEVYYIDFKDKKDVLKTREYVARSERIVSIGSALSPEPIWEVKTHWTVKRHLFYDLDFSNGFEKAWEIFTEIENSYSPGRIAWAKLEDYDSFEKY